MNKKIKSDQIIYHLCMKESWIAQEDHPTYLHESLEKEGFIHCSTAEQVNKVLNRYFKGVTDILQIALDPEHLDVPLAYEIAESDGDAYPHIFGEINKDAIVDIKILQQN